MWTGSFICCPIFCARIFAIACGYEDADDLDRLRFDPALKRASTSASSRSAEHIYETIYCARGQAENFIKLHKAQLSSDRTSCRSPLANQMRLILHTAAYWLMLTVRDAIPKAHALALVKLGARVIEMASRVRLAFAAACPDATLAY